MMSDIGICSRNETQAARRTQNAVSDANLMDFDTASFQPSS